MRHDDDRDQIIAEIISFLIVGGALALFLLAVYFCNL